jgi:hypothetical protein
MLGDDLCTKKESTRSAIGLFKAITKDYFNNGGKR